MTTVNWTSSTEEWNLVSLCVKNAFSTFVEGAPGLGKTFAGMNADGNELPVYQVTFNPDASVQEYQGTYTPTESGAWVWRDGPIMLAYRNGGILVLNEMGRASDAVLDFLLSILDSRESSAITLMSGETVKRNLDLRIVATSNAPFAKLPEALQDRFEARLKVNTPHPNIVTRLNSWMPGLGDMVRRSYGEGNKKPTITSREAFAYAKLARTMGSDAAAQAIWGYTSPDLVNEVKLACELTTK